jgi:predicted secreted protein
VGLASRLKKPDKLTALKAILLMNRILFIVLTAGVVVASADTNVTKGLTIEGQPRLRSSSYSSVATGVRGAIIHQFLWQLLLSNLLASVGIGEYRC